MGDEQKQKNISHTGWCWPALSQKAHYFEAGHYISICEHMVSAGVREDLDHENPNNCPECMRRREKLTQATPDATGQGEGVGK